MGIGLHICEKGDQYKGCKVDFSSPLLFFYMTYNQLFFHLKLHCLGSTMNHLIWLEMILSWVSTFSPFIFIVYMIPYSSEENLSYPINLNLKPWTIDLTTFNPNSLGPSNPNQIIDQYDKCLILKSIKCCRAV